MDDDGNPGATVSAMPFNHVATRAALTEVTARTVELVARIGDPGRRVVGLAWTEAETAAHILIGLRGFTDALMDRLDVWAPMIPSAPTYPERMGGMTTQTLSAIPSRDPATLSRLISEASDAFLEASAGRSELERLPTPWYAEGASLSLGEATALLLGEQVVHGFDLARTMRVSWPIERALALLVVPVVLTMMPVTLDPVAARGVRAVYAFHLRGGPEYALSVRDQSLSVAALDGFAGRIDCHISADPVAFIMVGYGRLAIVRGIARGKLFAWGRAPWLGLRMKRLFHNP